MVKLAGDCCTSDVSAALLNYKVQNGIVFFFFIPIVLVSCSCIPGAVCFSDRQTVG